LSSVMPADTFGAFSSPVWLGSAPDSARANEPAASSERKQISAPKLRQNRFKYSSTPQNRVVDR
jgi:hypothetical protein